MANQQFIIRYSVWCVQVADWKAVEVPGGETVQAAVEQCKVIRASLDKEIEQTFPPITGNRVMAPAPGQLVDYGGFTIVSAA